MELNVGLCFFPFYACPKEKIVSLRKLLKFEEAESSGLLVDMSSCSVQESGIVLFVSHRWLQNRHPDKANIKLLGLQALLKKKIFQAVTHIWIDYTCVPQDDKISQRHAIDSLAFYVAKSSKFVYLYMSTEDRASEIDYKSRGWCRLEVLSAAVAHCSIGYKFCMEKEQLDTVDLSQMCHVEDLNPIEGLFSMPGSEINRISLTVRILCARLLASGVHSHYETATRIRRSLNDWRNRALKCLSSIYIQGVTGPKGSYVNGSYKPTDEISNGATVYSKVGDTDKWMEYQSNQTWAIKRTSRKGTTVCWAYVACNPLRAVEECTQVEWMVSVPGGFEFQPVTVVGFLQCSKTINIQGVTGPKASSVNGTFKPTDEISNGATVYSKVGDTDKWIEYQRNRKWAVKRTSSKGTTRCWAYVTCDPLRPLEECLQANWMVSVSGSESFEAQSVTLVGFLQCLNTIVIQEASGSAVFVNGTYKPTHELSNGATVYAKVGDTNKWIEYQGDHAWAVKETSNKGSTRCWAYVPCDPVRPLEECTQVDWMVIDESGVFEAQPYVKVFALVTCLKSIAIQGVKGACEKRVNGTYKPTDEISNGATVYSKVGDSNAWIEYQRNHKWGVKKTSSKGTTVCWAYVACDPLRPLDECAQADWMVCTSGGFEAQPVTVVGFLQCFSTINIQGATGPKASCVNGTFKPTDEISNGATVYSKVGDTDKWIEYQRNQKWAVKRTSSKGTTKCWAYVACDSLRPLEECMQVDWMVSVSGGEGFEAQPVIVTTVGESQCLEFQEALASGTPEIVNGTDKLTHDEPSAHACTMH